MTRMAVVVAALLLCATACGDENAAAPAPAAVDHPTTAEEAAVVKRLADHFWYGFESTPEIPRCIATGLVNEVGIERLESGRALDKRLRVRDEWHLPKADANTVADVWLRCEDYKKYAAKLVVEEPDMNDPYVKRCVREVTPDDVREIVVTLASGALDFDEDEAPPGGLPGLFSMYRKLDRAGCSYEGD